MPVPAVTLPPPLQQALHRLNLAIDQLEASAARRAQSDALRANVDDELAIMQDDRVRLAADLDAALARGRLLAQANNDVSSRLEHAANAVRGLLVAAGSPAPGRPT